MWRTGRKVGRTIYAQLGATPSDDDPLIGVMDTRVLAERVVKAVNLAIPDVIDFAATCDWGDCDELTAALRWHPDCGYLAVCFDHAGRP